MDFEEEETKVRGRSHKRLRNGKRSISTPPTTTLTKSSTHTIVKSKKLVVNTAKRAFQKAEDELRQNEMANSSFSSSEINSMNCLIECMENNLEFSKHANQSICLSNKINLLSNKIQIEQPILEGMEFSL